ncbi:MAG: methylated-DNA--protein-cysteine methyltransferase [Thermoleophilia bacterium]|nr:methylated-DNA--protein-cysteine methyltransferase [Thermoleophilia bacterium]
MPGAYDAIGSLTGRGGVKIPGALMGAIVESEALSATRTRYSVLGWGVGELWTFGAVVLAHDFDFGDDESSVGVADGSRAHPPKGATSPPSGTVARKSSRMGYAFAPTSHPGSASGPGVTPKELAKRVTDYLAGAAVALDDVELDLSWATPFQRAVADALRGVPRGEFVTYGELAALAGYPGAARAAGTFCAANRFALLVPCHRVVGATGIGGYGATGVGVKRRLLALEGVLL